MRGLERQKHSPLKCIHIRGGGSIDAQSVYPMELMAVVAALRLADYVQIITKEIVTDSLGCCQIDDRRTRKKHPQLTNNFIALMNQQQHYIKSFEGSIR